MNWTRITDNPGKRYITAAAAALIVLGANILAYALESGNNLRLDTTREQYTVLSDGTKELLGALKEDVYIYYIEGQERQDITYGLLRSYAAESENVHFKAIDPDSVDAAALGAARDSVVVSSADMFSGAQKARTAVLSDGDLYPDSGQTAYSPANTVYFAGEQRITSAIEYVAQEKAGRVVFLTGQDEAKPCNVLLADIERMYYGAGFITADAPLDPKLNILAVLSPVRDVDDAGYRNIKAFLNAGGHAVFFLGNMRVDEATGAAEYPEDGLDNFKLLLSAYGINVGNGVVVGGDPARTYKSPANIMPSFTEEGRSALCIPGEPLRPVLAYASPIEITQAADVSSLALLETDAACRTAPAEFPLSLGDESGTAGEYVVGAAARSGESGIAVFTSSSFVTSDSDYAYRGNSELILNTLKIMGSGQQAASIPVKTVYDAVDAAYSLRIRTDSEKALLMMLAAGAPALAVFLSGLVRWARRRKL